MNKKILAIGAHFDDIEIGCAGTLLKHIQEGDEVFMLVVTSSGYHNQKKHIRKSSDAMKEGQESAKAIGASLLTLDYPTLKLEANDELIFAIQNIAEQIKPDRIYTQSMNDCHLDHLAVGKATLAACRNFPQILCYKSNSYMTGEPFTPNFFINISEFIEQKEKSLKIFRSEWPKPLKWIEMSRALSCYYGGISGVKYAEGFFAIKFIEN